MPRFLTVSIALLISSCEFAGKVGDHARYQPLEGDILFQSLPNPVGMDLVDAIEGSTGSPYSHCGMVFQEDGRWKVIEAIGPVKITPLDDYIARGRGDKVSSVVTRSDPRSTRSPE